jgi:hypothetical protein
MMIGGVTALESLIKLSFAVSLWHDFVPTSKAMTSLTATPWVWPRSCCCSGGNLPAVVGGKVSSLRTSEALKAS